MITSGVPDAERAVERSADPGVAGRVARNSVLRAAGELVGKFSSLALMSVLARQEGVAGLGVFVFALAWAELSTVLIGAGTDRLLLRRVARDHSEVDRCLYAVGALKLAEAAPLIVASWLLVWLLGYDEQTRVIVYLLTVSLLLDSLSTTVFSVFDGVERGHLIGLTLMIQRLVAAALGVAALLVGQGVALVASALLVASAAALAVAVVVLARQMGLPAFTRRPGALRELRHDRPPLAAQELLSSGIARLDAVLISAFAGATAVGLYGAAYRLLEATLFVSLALTSAFSAMYTYLGRSTVPTVDAVVARSLKLSLVLLAPVAVTLAVLPGPILGLLFGSRFDAAVTPLRILAPTVVVLGIVMLTSALVASRRAPRVLLGCFALGLAVNLVANVILIPAFGASGAASAMLATEVVLAVVLVRITVRLVGRLDLRATVGSALCAGMGMALVMLALAAVLPVALLAGTLVYVGVFVVVERRLAPGDLELVLDAARRRLPARRQGKPEER